MSGLIEKAKKWFGEVKSAPVERKVADMLSGGGIEQDKFPDRVSGATFNAGVTYFGIRLSGLHMVDARRFTKQLLPLCVCLAEFEHGGQRRAVPFSIGPDVIRQKLKDAGIADDKQAKPAWIELRDLTVVRPTPVNDANLSLYTGLFSMPGDDLVKTLLNVVGTVGTALGQPAIGPGLKVAETVYDSFGALLGLNQVNQVAAALIGNALTEAGSGYLLVANIGAETFKPNRGRVVNGRLCWPTYEHEGAAVMEFDYALLALERYDTIIERGTGLAPVLFEEPWAAVRRASSKEAFEDCLGKLRDAISASSDVTEDDRIALLGGYSAVAEKLIEKRWPSKTADLNRSGANATSLIDRLDDVAAQLDTSVNEKDRTLPARLRSVSGALREHHLDPVESDDAKAVVAQDEFAILGAAQAIRAGLLKSGTMGDVEAARSISAIVSRGVAGNRILGALAA